MSNYCLRTLFAGLSSAVLASCIGDDSGRSAHSGAVTVTFADPSRVAQQIARADLGVRYSVSVNGELEVVRDFSNASAAPSSISVSVSVGDVLEYDIEWRHRDFGVITADASGREVISSSTSPTLPFPNYDYAHNDDMDSHVNDAEIDQGFSPLDANDNPGNQFISRNDPERVFVNSQTWDEPVFACRNPPATGDSNTWFWILKDDGTISGVEEFDGVYGEFPNRGAWTFVNSTDLEILNERGEGMEWTWTVESRSARLSLNFVTEWGECIRVAGPPIDMPTVF